jgi:alpha-amylase
MMKHICLIFHSHQPVRLKNYRFYEIGGNTSYFNEEYNKNWLTNTADKKFIPVNKILLETFNNQNLQFKISFSFSGCTLDLFEAYTPHLIRDLKMINQIGNVEFLGGTYSHANTNGFLHEDLILQIENQKKKIFNLFGQIPSSFVNNGLYCNQFLSNILTDLGFKVMLNNTADVYASLSHPNTVFEFPDKPGIKLMFGNKDITKAISASKIKVVGKENMTAERLVQWIMDLPEDQNIVTIFIDYKAIIKDKSSDSAILDLLQKLPVIAKEKQIGFITPAEIINDKKFSTSPISLKPMKSQLQKDMSDSADQEFQKEILNILFSLKNKVYQTKNDSLIKTWYYLQDNSNLDTYEDDGKFNEIPEDGFQGKIGSYINFRNILEDLTLKVNRLLEEKNTDFNTSFTLSETSKAPFQKTVNQQTTSKNTLF